MPKPKQRELLPAKSHIVSLRRPLIVPLLSLWAALAVCLLPFPAHADTLGDALDHILSIPALKGGITGAVIQRVGDGQILYAREADRRLMPASNRKLFTSAAALEVLGGGFTFKTDVLATSKPDAGGTLHGDICLRGVGDSLLSPDDLDEMAKAVAGAGVRHIEGRIIGDGGVFQGGPYGEGWSWDDLPYYYAAQVAGLEVSRGVLAVHVTAGADAGDQVRVTVDQPTAYLPIVNTATTGDKNAANDCDISRPSGRNMLVVTGTVPLGGKANGLVTVEDPAHYAATVFKETLERRGVLVTGLAMSGARPDAATVPLGSHVSIPLSLYIARMNKPSDNLLAESLIRTLGAVKGKAGTYGAGHTVETAFFKSLGLDTSAIDLVDGSGLSRFDLITPHVVVGLLRAMHEKADWQAYYDSLPIAGVDGSLRNRMKGTPAANNVHAKTGSLGGVSSLSGYVKSMGGDLYVFTVIMNNFPGSDADAHAAQDKFAVTLATLP